jgi:acetylornithine deacetylase
MSAAMSQARAAELTGLTAELVAIDSVNPTLVAGGAGEAAVAAFVAAWLSRAGLEVEVLERTPGAPRWSASCADTARGAP